MKPLSKAILLLTLIPTSYYFSSAIKSTFSYLYYNLDPLNERINNPIPAQHTNSLEFKSLNNPISFPIKIPNIQEKYKIFIPTPNNSNYEPNFPKI